jgi:hypothetical protein
VVSLGLIPISHLGRRTAWVVCPRPEGIPARAASPTRGRSPSGAGSFRRRRGAAASGGSTGGCDAAGSVGSTGGRGATRPGGTAGDRGSAARRRRTSCASRAARGPVRPRGGRSACDDQRACPKQGHPSRRCCCHDRTLRGVGLCPLRRTVSSWPRCRIGHHLSTTMIAGPAHNAQMRHAAFHGRTPDEMYFGTACCYRENGQHPQDQGGG